MQASNNNKTKYIHIYIYIPGTCLFSFLGIEIQPSKRRPFTIKTRVIWVQIPQSQSKNWDPLHGGCSKFTC